MSICLALSAIGWGRPLLTEEAASLGRFNFEAGMSLSFREDRFDTPEKIYETVTIPVHVAFGFHQNLDIGVELNYFSHRLETPLERFTGSVSGQVSPYMKISPWDSFGVMGIWHTSTSEESQELPIARGNDLELLALITLPTPWTTHINVGYIWKGPYASNFGVIGGPISQVEQGDIFESKGAIEIPLLWNFNLLGELAYYEVDRQMIAGQTIQNTDGEAMDALAGLTWAWKGWDVGLGVSFGLLEESHTSFDLIRGAGDMRTEFSIAYKLKPRKPEKWE